MTRSVRAATLPVAALFLFAGAAPSGDDLVFIGGRVVDGTGKAAFRGDVAVRDGRIAAVGDLAPDRIARARRRIDATGLVVAPGFIDLLGQSEYNALVDRRAASKITQGITTEVTGEGESIAPLDETLLKSNEDTYRYYGLRPDWSSLLSYFMRFRRTPPTINLGTFVGLGGLRRMVVGTEDRRAGPTELDRMKTLVAQAMEDGALGISTSLQYVPDLYNSTDEIIACAKVAASRGGVYFTHQRSGGEPDRCVTRGGVPDRPGSPHPGERLAPEDRLPAQLGSDAEDPRRVRRGARRGIGRGGEPVPVERGLERAGRLPPALGARGRTREAAGAVARSRGAGAASGTRWPRTPTPGRTSGTARVAGRASCSPPSSIPSSRNTKAARSRRSARS